MAKGTTKTTKTTEATGMSEPTRDDIRSAIFSTKTFEEKEQELFGQKVVIRQPSLGEIIDYQDSDKDTGVIDLLIGYCFVPGTNKRVFEEADRAGLKRLPFNADLVKVTENFAELTGIDMEDAGGN